MRKGRGRRPKEGFIVDCWKWSLGIGEKYHRLYLCRCPKLLECHHVVDSLQTHPLQTHPLTAVSFILTQIIANPYVTTHRAAYSILQEPFFFLHLIGLDLVPNLEIIPVLEAYTALPTLLSLGDILLDVLQALKFTCVPLVFHTR